MEHVSRQDAGPIKHMPFVSFFTKILARLNAHVLSIFLSISGSFVKFFGFYGRIFNSTGTGRQCSAMQYNQKKKKKKGKFCAANMCCSINKLKLLYI